MIERGLYIGICSFHWAYDTERILPKLAEFENTENPDLNQVDNFSIDDGEIDQPVYEGPQTRSRTRKLMKANCLMADLFDIKTGKICDDVSDVIVVVPKVNDKSIRDLVLEFWYKQVFMFYCVCCDLAEAGVHSIYCQTRFLVNHFFSGGGGDSMDCLCSRTKPRA